MQRKRFVSPVLPRVVLLLAVVALGSGASARVATVSLP
jgi:hypothetical protein